MNSSFSLQRIIAPLLFLVAQVVFARNLVLFNKAFCFLYIGYILLMPIQMGRLRLIFTAFLFGLTLDIFYDSLGMHAAATVFLAYLRPVWLNLITPRGGYENVNMPSIPELSLGWFMAYALPLLLLHHGVLFFVEAGGFHLFFFTLWKVLFSTVFTFVTLAIIQYFFYGKNRGL
jgi:hypothetical protein